MTLDRRWPIRIPAMMLANLSDEVAGHSRCEPLFVGEVFNPADKVDRRFDLRSEIT